MADTLENHFPSEETLVRVAAALEDMTHGDALAERTAAALATISSNADLVSAIETFTALWNVTPEVSHKCVYRGASLGTSLTSEQKSKIADGSFDGLYVGDYWTINGRVYRIADINYYYNSGDTGFTKNHLVIVPDASFGNDKMNDTNITTGAYKGSKMYTDASSVLNTARATIANDFGSALATHRIYLQNAVANGYASGGEWTDSTVDLMNEPMVYGSYTYTPAGNGSIVPNRVTVEKSQLALFRLNHRMINPGRYTYWLRDVVSAALFANVGYSGLSSSNDASASRGVRPAFCITGN